MITVHIKIAPHNGYLFIEPIVSPVYLQVLPNKGESILLGTEQWATVSHYEHRVHATNHMVTMYVYPEPPK